MKIKSKVFALLSLSIFVLSCNNSNQDSSNYVFKEFTPLKKDSTVYFNVFEENGKLFCKFNSYTNRDSLYFSNINFGNAEIKMDNNIISISIKRKNKEYNVNNMELFDFNLMKRKRKKCSFNANSKKYEYDLYLRDVDFNNSDSIFWFQMSNNIVISCEVANFFVSPKKGIICVFESRFFDSTVVTAINPVGNIPKHFLPQIEMKSGIIQ